MATKRTALTAVDERFANDRAGIAACAKVIREALELEPNLSDVEQAASPMEIHPCIEKESLRRVGIAASDSVLEMMARYPRVMLYKHLRHEWIMAANGSAVHPLIDAVGPGRISATREFLDLVAETLGQVHWIARNSGTPAEVLAVEAAMWAEVDAYYREQLAPAWSKLTEPKVKQQRWVVRGVYDRSVLGIPQIGISVEEWGTDVTLRGLSGEQRHRLLKRYRENDDIFDFLDGVLFDCARDPLDTIHPFFSNLTTVQEMRSTTARELTQIALWLSGLVEGPESGPPRAGTDRGDSEFLLRAVHLAASDPETLMVRQNIVAHFLWCNKDYWESAQGPSLFGLLGVSFKRAWLNWVKEGVLSGDGWADEYGHFHKGKLKQEVRSDQALDYIANHEKTGPRSARRPDCSDYDGDVENAHGFYKWEAETGKREQIETDAYRTAPQEIETAQRLVNISDADPTNDGNPEIAVTRRCWRNLWLYKRPSSLGLGDFEEWIDPEVDIQRTFAMFTESQNHHRFCCTKCPLQPYTNPTGSLGSAQDERRREPNEMPKFS